MSVKLTFLGAASTVTGSKTLVTWSGGSAMVDCGLFQGFKQHRVLNWKPIPVDTDKLGAVLMTHAHIDHSGALPVLVKQGYRGPIHASGGTCGLVRILLPDSAHLQEEQAERHNRRGTSRHSPALPLYTAADAERASGQLEEAEFGRSVELPGGARATFRRAGHIVGASQILLEADGRRILFSGDVGRQQDPLHPSPQPVDDVDALVTESTYGNRQHVEVDPEAVLEDVINRTIGRGGHVIVPAFAVGRTQRLLYHIHRLRQAGRIPRVPVFLNSPLATKATEVFRLWHHEGTVDDATCEAFCRMPQVVESREDSIELNRRKEPCIMIAGSGMIAGGRVIHHIRAFAPDSKHTILLTGFMASGTRGAQILAGADRVKIFGEYVPIRCEVAEIAALSAHADKDELLMWMGARSPKVGRVFIQHGEPEASDALRVAVEERFGWRCAVPFLGESFEV